MCVRVCVCVRAQEYGLSQLHDGATALNLRSMLCALLLLCYYTFLTFILGSTGARGRMDGTHGTWSLLVVCVCVCVWLCACLCIRLGVYLCLCV